MTELRVFGPPGTGKTTYLAGQVERAVDRYGTDGVIVASFTRTAAYEIASRVHDLGLGREQVGTLHALCYRALGSPTIAETKAKEFNDYQAIYQLSVEGGNLDEPEQAFVTDGDKLLADYQRLRAMLVPRARWPLDAQSFGAAWDHWKDVTQYVDFTDMIENALANGVPPPGDPVIGFFDEAQDFTPLELALVRQWATQLEYVVIAGDDDQSIYSFKGSSPDAFLDPPLPDSQKRTLGQSYRMPLAVHLTSQRWISQVARRELKHFFPRQDEDTRKPVQGHAAARPDLRYSAPQALVAEAAEHTEYGRSVMLLASCSYQVAAYVQELRKQGLPFHNPYRRTRGDWNPLRSSRGTTTAQRLLSLLRFDPAVWGNEARPWTCADVRDWAALLPRSGIVKRGAFKAIEDAPGEQVLTQDMADAAFEPGVIDAIFNDPLRFLEDKAAPAKQQALAYPLKIASIDPRRLQQTPRITVGTVHSVKGGEADIVYLAPDLSRAGMAGYLAGGADSVVRQMYVGMTRAREQLHLMGASTSAAVQWQEVV